MRIGLFVENHSAELVAAVVYGNGILILCQSGPVIVISLCYIIIPFKVASIWGQWVWKWIWVMHQTAGDGWALGLVAAKQPSQLDIQYKLLRRQQCNFDQPVSCTLLQTEIQCVSWYYSCFVIQSCLTGRRARLKCSLNTVSYSCISTSFLKLFQVLPLMSPLRT